MSEQQKMSFEEILEQWTKAYAFCSVFEIQYILGQVGKEEYQDFLDEFNRNRYWAGDASSSAREQQSNVNNLLNIYVCID